MEQYPYSVNQICFAASLFCTMMSWYWLTRVKAKKLSSVFQHAIAACQTETQAVSRDSQLSNLAHGQ